MKKINSDRIIQLLKLPFVKVGPIIDDLCFADSKRRELNKLKGPCEEYYRRIPRPAEPREFIASVASLVDFSKYFIKETFKEPELQEKLLSNLKDFQFVNVAQGIRYGGCGFSIADGKFNMEKWAYLGYIDRISKICYTSFYKLRTLLHENAHASNQKFDMTNFVNKLNIDEDLIKNDPQKALILFSQSIKDHSICEIESLFMEKVFRHFLATKADKIVADKMNMGLSADELQIEAYNLQQLEIENFLNRVNFIKKLNYDKNISKHGVFRYVVGEVGSRILFEKYLENPAEALKIYGEFLKTNAQLDIDEAMQMLSGGKLNNYPEAMQKYRSIFEKKLQKLDAKDKTTKEDGNQLESNY